MPAWLEWLHAEHAAMTERVALGQTVRPAVQPDGQLMHAHAHHHGHAHQDHD